MRIVVIADTHGRHEDLGILEGDVLIHCGDFCDASYQDAREVRRIDAWFAQQRFEVILCIGGNHDFGVAERFENGDPIFDNAVWLLDQSYTHRGVKFFGSPWVPHLQGWAFYLSDEGLKRKWSLIPEDTDVLVTHTPPYGILDQSSSRRAHHGCQHLLDRVREIQPRFHVFGHNHSSAGYAKYPQTTFINAAVVDSSLKVVRGAAVLDLAKTGGPWPGHGNPAPRAE